MASDTTASECLRHGNDIALSVDCSSEDEIRSLFSRFRTGSTVIHDLHREPWGAVFAVLTDRFGIRWMFNYHRSSTSRT